MRTVLRDCFLLSSIALLALAFAGCGGGSTYPTRIQVFVDGKPLNKGRVEFNPVDPKLKTAGGQIDADGWVSLNTMGENDGAMPGEYKVTVNAQDEKVIKESNFPADRKVEIIYLVHENYRTLDKTPLKATVPGVTKLELKKDGT